MGGVATSPSLNAASVELQRIAEVVWEIPAEARADMRVPGRVFADSELLEAIGGDRERVARR